ncbi:DUF2058 family protein [Lysobacter sp. CFH 32150]|uniref:DUF2058 domain-containing protein n=1 Tax=Lysobacter sp. CFH 32150 TaxID=2927128 RepID=UPI001FA6C648|nr:DUF2058 family protein [Lysobacter sp. CFH 32150]MCI4567124.1 DUF2058 family protein [Lysobacter sp. CFH 32150]
MSDTLRDQLLGLGFKPAPKPERKPERKPDPRPAGKHTGKPSHAKPAHARPAAGQGKPKPQRTREEIDLAKAYAIRAQKEKDERIEAERLKQEEARKRREAKAQLAVLLKDKAQNDPAAEFVRHFDYGGKIKRVYVTEAQLKALNAGELGVVQMDGRYQLVDAALLAQAEAIFAPAVALKVDPNAPADADPYADPQYQVPDDLVW